MATPTVRTNLTGLPRRLVAAGLLSEADAADAQRDAAAEKLLLVSYLVRNKKLNARAVASAASEEFGVPAIDLDAVDLGQAPLKEVEAQLIEKHHALPLFRRGRKLFVAVSDPTNLQALDEIKFKTGLTVDAVIVEEDKLVKSIEKAVQSMDTSMKDLTDEDVCDLDITAGDDEAQPGDDVSSADIEDAPVVKFVNKVLLHAISKGASNFHLCPYEKAYRVRFRQDGMLREVVKPPMVL